MLQKTSKLVAQCHDRATECARSAKGAQTEEDRAFYLNMERRWLFLARSYEFTDRLGSISTELDRHHKRRN